ncbi:MAG: hypothetical protein Fur0016_24820 [Anaerolineales bacterium]
MAASSHRNADFPSLLLSDFDGALTYLWQNLAHVTRNGFLAVLSLPGFLLLLFRRQFHLPLAFLLSLAMGEASFFPVLLAAMMAGAFLERLVERFSGAAALRWSLNTLIAALLLIVPNQLWLFQQIKETRAWQVIYENERYMVWQGLR